MHISPEDPHEPISTRFGTADCLADLIARGSFLAISLGVLILNRILAFSYLQALSLTQFWHCRTACDLWQDTH